MFCQWPHSQCHIFLLECTYNFNIDYIQVHALAVSEHVSTQAYPEYIIYYRIKSSSQPHPDTSDNISCTGSSNMVLDTPTDDTPTNDEQEMIVESDTHSDLVAETSCTSIEDPLLMNSSTSSLESSNVP